LELVPSEKLCPGETSCEVARTVMLLSFPSVAGSITPLKFVSQ
jgi:hypothetical protein